MKILQYYSLILIRVVTAGTSALRAGAAWAGGPHEGVRPRRRAAAARAWHGGPLRRLFTPLKH